jgi:hypothetical protein
MSGKAILYDCEIQYLPYRIISFLKIALSRPAMYFTRFLDHASVTDSFSAKIFGADACFLPWNVYKKMEGPVSEL